jgi:hypothetical protein
VKTFAKQPTRMRLPIIVVRRQRAAGLAIGHDMLQIAALRGIGGEGRALRLGFSRGAEKRDLAAALFRETVGSDPPAGEIIRGEFPDRHRSRYRGEGVRGVMILMRAFERRNPNRFRLAATDRRGDVASSAVQIEPQPPRRGIAKTNDFDPEQPRGGERLLVTPPHALRIARPVPRPERALWGHARRQIQNENTRPGRDGARCRDRACNDLIVGMRSQDQDAARDGIHRRADGRLCAAARHTGSKSCSRTSPQLGTRAST